MASAPRAASRFSVCGFISMNRTIARGVTGMDVGSGALLGRLCDITDNGRVAKLHYGHSIKPEHRSKWDRVRPFSRHSCLERLSDDDGNGDIGPNVERWTTT